MFYRCRDNTLLKESANYNALPPQLPPPLCSLAIVELNYLDLCTLSNIGLFSRNMDCQKVLKSSILAGGQKMSNFKASCIWQS